MNYLKNNTILDTNLQTILVAEDVPSQFLLLAVLLRRHKYNVLHALNGLEAVNMVKSQPIHIILMDIEMPIMNGFAATQEIRKFNLDIPIIAITASIFSSYEESAYSCGCNDFLPKPINLKSLITTIEKWSLTYTI